MSPGEFLERRLRENEAQLAQAEAQAIAAGKERFDLVRLEQLLGEEQAPDREQSLRRSYYIFHTELGSLAEFAALLRELEVWD